MTRASHQIPAFLVPDPTRAEQREALWRMSPAERVAVMYRGDLSLLQCLAWAARYPEQVPLLNGEWWFIATRTPEVAEAHERGTPR
jgi:predicted lysophospholipase L1 biosynthesis ABC-type transport system permease subunit